MLNQTIKKFLIKILIICFSISTSYAKITDIFDMAGFYNCFNEEASYLSPFHAIPLKRLPSSFYFFGNAVVELGATQSLGRMMPVVKNIKGGDNTTILTLQLFYALGNEFNPTTEPTNPATYLTPETIGKIVGFMHELIIANKQRDFAHEKEIFTPLIQKFEQLRDIINQKKDGKPEFEKLEKHIGFDQKDIFFWMEQVIRLSTNMKIIKENTDIAQKITEIKGMIKQIKKISDQLKKFATEELTNSLAELIKQSIPKDKTAHTKKATQNSTQFARLIIESLKECGDLKTSENLLQKYPNYVTFFLLICFLYEKANNIGDLVAYLNQLPQTTLKEEWRQIIQTRFNPKEISDIALNTEFDETKERKDQFLNNNYEKICIASLYQSVLNYPPQFDWSKWKFTVTDNPEDRFMLNVSNGNFRPCVEFTIFDFIQFLLFKLGLFDPTPQIFNTEEIPNAIKEFLKSKGKSFDEKKLDQQLLLITNFFRKFQKLDTKEAIVEWLKLVSNISGIKYLMRKKETESSQKVNFEKVRGIPKHTENFIHPIKDEDVKSTYGKNSTQTDSSYYLFELAGLPSNLINLTNYFLGFNNQNFQELCRLFNLTPINTNLQNLNDDYIYKEQIILKPEFKSQGTTISFNISAGHNDFTLKPSAVTTNMPDIISYAGNFGVNDYVKQNIFALAPQGVFEDINFFIKNIAKPYYNNPEQHIVTQLEPESETYYCAFPYKLFLQNLFNGDPALANMLIASLYSQLPYKAAKKPNPIELTAERISNFIIKEKKENAANLVIKEIYNQLRVEEFIYLSLLENLLDKILNVCDIITTTKLVNETLENLFSLLDLSLKNQLSENFINSLINKIKLLLPKSSEQISFEISLDGSSKEFTFGLFKFSSAELIEKLRKEGFTELFDTAFDIGINDYIETLLTSLKMMSLIKRTEQVQIRIDEIAAKIKASLQEKSAPPKEISFDGNTIKFGDFNSASENLIEQLKDKGLIQWAVTE